MHRGPISLYYLLLNYFYITQVILIITKLAILLLLHPHSISNYKSNLTPHLPTKIKAKSSFLPEEINNLTNYAAGLIVPHDKRKFDCIMTQKSFLKSAR